MLSLAQPREAKPQFSESLSVGKNLEVQLKTHHSQIPILNLWMNWKKLYYF